MTSLLCSLSSSSFSSSWFILLLSLSSFVKLSSYSLLPWLDSLPLSPLRWIVKMVRVSPIYWSTLSWSSSSSSLYSYYVPWSLLLFSLFSNTIVVLTSLLSIVIVGLLRLVLLLPFYCSSNDDEDDDSNYDCSCGFIDLSWSLSFVNAESDCTCWTCLFSWLAWLDNMVSSWPWGVTEGSVRGVSNY